jgi:hypothetical protein
MSASINDEMERCAVPVDCEIRSPFEALESNADGKTKAVAFQTLREPPRQSHALVTGAAQRQNRAWTAPPPRPFAASAIRRAIASSAPSCPTRACRRNARRRCRICARDTGPPLIEAEVSSISTSSVGAWAPARWNSWENSIAMANDKSELDRPPPRQSLRPV